MQPPVAKKDPSAVNMAHMLKRTDTMTETHSNGSEVEANIMNVSPQVTFFFNIFYVQWL